jgi:hypothetical protein
METKIAITILAYQANIWGLEQIVVELASLDPLKIRMEQGQVRCYTVNYRSRRGFNSGQAKRRDRSRFEASDGASVFCRTLLFRFTIKK